MRGLRAGQSFAWRGASRWPVTLRGLALLLTLPVAALAKLDVVATTPDFGIIAKEIGGRHVAVTTLARPAEDPHFVDPKPSFIVKLNRADVLIEGGAELELGWLPPLVQSARNAKILPGAPGRIACNEGIEMLEVPQALDRSKGDIHAAGNPHYMMDPLNAKTVAAHICEAFCAIDPPAGEDYRANLRRFTVRLETKLAEWQALLAPYEGRRIVSYHNSWPYFGRRFGLKLDLFLEPKPGIPPSPAHLAEVIREMGEQNIRVIIVAPYLNRRVAETVARNADAVILDVSQFPGGVKGTEGGYLELIDHLVRSLAKALAAK